MAKGKEQIKIIVFPKDIDEDPWLKWSLKTGEATNPELWIDSATAAHPDKVQEHLEWAQEEWQSILAAKRERQKRERQY